MSQRLRERYPQDITIVLQHQFWDLEVDAQGFGVTLSFSDQLHRLRVPFSAIKVFEEIYVMTSGGPAGSTYSALFYTYSRAFQDFQYGLAAAAGLILAVISIFFGFLNFKLTRGGKVDA